MARWIYKVYRVHTEYSRAFLRKVKYHISSRDYFVANEDYKIENDNFILTGRKLANRGGIVQGIGYGVTSNDAFLSQNFISDSDEYGYTAGAKGKYLLEIFYYRESEPFCQIYSINPKKSKGAYIRETTAEDGTYPNNGAQGFCWYVKDRLANQAPSISGSNLDLGSKMDDFIIDYIVSDSDGDSVTVDIFEDQVKKVAGKSVALNTKYTYPITLNNFTLGRHTIKIVASDGQATAERTYTFTKSNTAPVISGEDQDLGARSTAFTENFTVTDKNKDDVAVTITLDDLEIATISSAQDKELSYTITDDQLLKFEIGSVHTVTIKADDGKGGVAYRRHTFTKVNRPPIISGQDSDLGEKEKPFSLSYSFTDVEKDPISYALYVDGIKKLEKSEVEDGKSYTYTIPHDEFIQLKYGKHTIKIEAWDDYSKSSPQVRTYTFERISGGLEVEVKINEFTVQPKKVIGVPHGIFADDATTEVYVCNNYLDSSPTWEDMSAESKAARAYAFKNETKTAEKWSIGIKVIIENGSSGVSSVLRGLKGGYE